MQRDSWMHRYALSCLRFTFLLSERHQVEGVLQEMRELSICGGN